MNLKSAYGTLLTATNNQQATWDAIKRIKEVYMGIIEYQETLHSTYYKVLEIQAIIK